MVAGFALDTLSGWSVASPKGARAAIASTTDVVDLVQSLQQQSGDTGHLLSDLAADLENLSTVRPRSEMVEHASFNQREILRSLVSPVAVHIFNRASRERAVDLLSI